MGQANSRYKRIQKCGCPLSGCYNTHVFDEDGENCDSWKKASDEYLMAIGEIE